jgi:two-component system nitrate/nitrite response regulator NarL
MKSLSAYILYTTWSMDTRGTWLRPISIFASELQPIVLEGLYGVLAKCDDLVFAGAVSRINDAFEETNRLRPDVALIDLSSGGLTSALRYIASLKAASINTYAVLWVVELPEMEAFRALQMGARGIVKKAAPVAKLLECLREVGSGKIWMDEAENVTAFLQRKETSRLTPREREVVHLICRGMKNRQIAENLRITPGTVKVHLMHIFEKTGLKDRLALAVHGQELVGPEPQSVEPQSKEASTS